MIPPVESYDSSPIYYQNNKTHTEFYQHAEGKEEHLQHLASWNEMSGLTLHSNFGKEEIRDKTLRIATNRSPPFVTRLLNDESAEGFVPDIVAVMSEAYGFKPSYVESFDGYYGTKVNGTWNGLIKMVLDDAVDFVATDLAMILQRSLCSTLKK